MNQIKKALEWFLIWGMFVVIIIMAFAAMGCLVAGMLVLIINGYIWTCVSFVIGFMAMIFTGWWFEE